MYTKGVSSVLDYSVEGKEEEAQFDAALNMTLKTIEFAREEKRFRLQYLTNWIWTFSTIRKTGDKAHLTENEQKEWNHRIERFDIACKTAFERCFIID